MQIYFNLPLAFRMITASEKLARFQAFRLGVKRDELTKIHEQNRGGR